MSTNREIAERLGILICDYARDASLDGWMLNSQRKDGSFTNPNAERARQTIIVLEAAKAALTAKDEACKAAVEKARREENEACSLIAADYDGKGMDPRGYSDQLGDAYLTKMDIADAIRSRLTAQQGEARPDTQKGEG